MVKVRGRFLAIAEEAGARWYSPVYTSRSQGLAAGISAAEALTHARWNRIDPMWTESGGETDLLNVIPTAAVAPGAYQPPAAPGS
ncbi:hypothetical protein AB0A73_21695 [Glycomyces sp. NPDC047369]